MNKELTTESPVGKFFSRAVAYQRAHPKPRKRKERKDPLSVYRRRRAEENRLVRINHLLHVADVWERRGKLEKADELREMAANEQIATPSAASRRKAEPN